MSFIRSLEAHAVCLSVEKSALADPARLKTVESGSGDPEGGASHSIRHHAKKMHAGRKGLLWQEA